MVRDRPKEGLARMAAFAGRHVLPLALIGV